MAEYSTMSDQDLVAATCNGQTDAFSALCIRYEEQLAGMLNSRGVSQADDIVQDSFIKAFLNISKYDPQFSFGQWIFAIAKNLHIDGIRKQKGTKVDIDEVITHSGTMNPEQSYISMQTRDNVEKQLEKLPKGYKDIVELRFLDELSYDEISQRLGIPMGTVKTKIHRARALLTNPRED